MFSALLVAALCASSVALSLASPVVAPKAVKDSRYVVPAANLTLKAYGGEWFEFAKTPNFFEIGLKCITATYGLQSDGTVSVVNEGIRNYPWFNREVKVEGAANVPNANDPAKLRVQFKNMPAPPADSTNYWVINTDYTQWSAVYSPPSAAFILTREQQPSKEVVQEALNELAIKTGITLSDMIITQQHDC